jgi:hypothetical protein
VVNLESAKNKKMPGLGPSATTRREPEMKTGAAVLPFSFSDLDARQSGVAKADTAFQAHPLVNRLNLA